MNKKRVFYSIDGTLVPCCLFKQFKRAIEQTDINYYISKAVLPNRIEFTVFPCPSFINEVNVTRFKKLKLKLL